MGTGQVAGSALLTGWVRVHWGPACGHCWAGNCSLPFQKAHLPFCVCVCVCEGVSVCLSLAICTAPWEIRIKGAAPPMPPDSISRGWSAGLVSSQVLLGIYKPSRAVCALDGQECSIAAPPPARGPGPFPDHKAALILYPLAASSIKHGLKR